MVLHPHHDDEDPFIFQKYINFFLKKRFLNKTKLEKKQTKLESKLLLPRPINESFEDSSSNVVHSLIYDARPWNFHTLR